MRLVRVNFGRARLACGARRGDRFRHTTTLHHRHRYPDACVSVYALLISISPLRSLGWGGPPALGCARVDQKRAQVQFYWLALSGRIDCLTQVQWWWASTSCACSGVDFFTSSFMLAPSQGISLPEWLPDSSRRGGFKVTTPQSRLDIRPPAGETSRRGEGIHVSGTPRPKYGTLHRGCVASRSRHRSERITVHHVAANIVPLLITWPGQHGVRPGR